MQAPQQFLMRKRCRCRLAARYLLAQEVGKRCIVSEFHSIPLLITLFKWHIIHAVKQAALISAFFRLAFSRLYKHLKIGYVINVSDLWCYISNIYIFLFQTASKCSSVVAPTCIISCFYTNMFIYMPLTTGSLLFLNAVCKPAYRRIDLKHASESPNTTVSANLLVF